MQKSMNYFILATSISLLVATSILLSGYSAQIVMPWERASTIFLRGFSTQIIRDLGITLLAMSVMLNSWAEKDTLSEKIFIFYIFCTGSFLLLCHFLLSLTHFN